MGMTELLQQLVEWFETASPQLWEILIKQVYVEATSDLVWGIIWLAVATALIFVGKWGWKCNEEHGDYNTDWEWVFVPSWVFSGILFPVGLAMLSSAIKWFVNPEFYAIRYILDKLTGG